MDFDQAWAALELGDSVAVSNGKPAPSSNTNGVPYKAWRSHNFAGSVAEKIEGEPRALRIELPPGEGNASVSYTILEGVGHVFTIL